MRIGAWRFDSSAISFYRLIQPLAALQGRGVEYSIFPYYPTAETPSKVLSLLYEMVSQFDLIILQRCYDIYLAQLMRYACDLAGKPMVFETDDDYFHISRTNPAYPIINKPGIIDRYHEILEMADGITTTTRELKHVLYPHNKNVVVLPNNIQYVSAGDYLIPKRDLTHAELEDGSGLRVKAQNGAYAVPAYATDSKTGRIQRIVRIGYTATRSHREDVKTILEPLRQVLKEEKNICMVVIGDEEVYQRISEGLGNVVHIPMTSNYYAYLEHIRNIDIGLAPLEDNLFNISKSQIKAVEYGSWGIPAVLPNMVTYAREFKNNKTCLFYETQVQFKEALRSLINDQELRDNLGRGARDRVRDYRLENSPANWKPRLEFYEKLIADKQPFKAYKTTEGNRNICKES